MAGLGPSRGGGGRRGRRSARRGRLSEINVTPFVDVMLVLLIVFMVTAPLLTVGVPVELPRTEARQLESEVEPLTVTIRADGTVFVQETVITKEELVAQMRAISREGYDRRVFIRADATAEYGLVADIMARLSTAGFRNLGLVTDTTESPPRRPGAPAPRGP
ncbi:MAG: protein TolR [Hyphomonadaceae bacterium]|nr:protein TolR [Hyphomonadaceae bacterium]MBX3510217.1 protein TolR [Hyphomonadaceae bacterium]